MSGTTWWLALDDDGLKRLAFDWGAVPRLTGADLRAFDALALPIDAPCLEIASYLREFDLSGDHGRSDADQRFFLVALTNKAHPEKAVLAQMVPGPKGSNRAVLKQKPLAEADDFALFEAARPTLEFIPDALPRWLRKTGTPGMAEFCELQFADHERQNQRLRSLSSQRILAGLLGIVRAAALHDKITTRRLKDVPLLDLATHRRLLGKAYSASVNARVSGPDPEQILTCLSVLNEQAREALGKRLFAHDANGDVRYLGLWES